MADVASAAGRRGGAFPPGALAPIAAGLLVAAMLLAAGAALGGGPLRWAAVALIAVSAAAAAFVLHALLAQRAPATAAEPAFEALVRALGEPAAIVAEDGALAAANQSWRERVGPHRRLARASLGETPALLRAAARDGQASQGATIGDAPYRLEAARLDGARFLVRLSPISPLAAPLAKAATATPAAQPASLDPFAAASPFGAALIEGADPFVGAILEVNEAWAAIAGAPAAAGSSLGALLTDASRADAAQRLAAGGAGPFEVTPNARRASVSHLYVSRLDGHAVAYLVDVTDQKQMQAQLAQSSKMQAIGQLAGGVAHDFNNLLTAILMNLSELEMRHPLGDPSFDGLARIRENAIRAAGLVGQLLTFSRKVTVQRETLDVGELISNVTVMLRRLLPESVGMETDYGRNLPQIRADRQQLENAVMNLVVNARDAVRGKGGGTITVRAARLSEADARGLGYEGQPMGEMALLEVADDGPGIPPEVMPKIFDPFFTTKAVGEGTGLGLATVYGIVKQMDGWIAPISRPGEGATFRIFLPVYEPPVLIEPPAPAPPKGRAAARDLSGVGRILFVEDEDAVRKVAARLLKARGYEVIEAADGEEALAIAEQNAGRIDLMISDVIMPGLDGPHLLKAARPYLADAPVMFISGYAEAEFSKVLEGEPGVSFLAKPIDITVLAERVKQALQRA
ncbi:MAG TPA: ATP-binding protein [Caulobacteraceae bacterium]|jgi:two-component system cell cycle sensor histidine kinase/response regulator CckA